jgi:protein-tyrosine-phosphatase
MSDGVLFICLGNSCRSIMAEALARQVLPGAINIGSAGLSPLGYVMEETLQVLKEIGIVTDGLWSKGLADVYLADFSALVNLTAHSLDLHLPRHAPGRVISYPVADPFGGTVAMYREARDNIRRFVTVDLPPQLFPR